MEKEYFVQARVARWEKAYILHKAEEARLSVSEYLRRCIFFHSTVVIPGLDDMMLELRRQGNNLNQLTRMAHQGALDAVDLEPCLEEYRKVWQTLNSLQSRSR